MNLVVLILLALLAASCATSTRQTENLLKDRGSLPKAFRIEAVPLIVQTKNYCGPATMAMAMNHAGRTVTMEELSSSMVTEKMEGTFRTDMVSAARRQGMLTLPVRNISSLLKEVSAGNPVIVFQNLGLSWMPKWHYAVVTGYDVSGPDVLLHSGEKKYHKTDMRFFERTWKLGDYWGLLVLPPHKLSTTAAERDHVDAAVALENTGMSEEARVAYLAITQRWPESLPTLIGLGNVYFSRKQFGKSVDYLETATRYHPKSAVAWHNLATALGSLGNRTKARSSSREALRLADEVVKKDFEKSLAPWLAGEESATQ
ncbi:MAG TPA: PA2778 family cysteine peptidase [Bacteriovoracaceae bacterium]|nr:PA2778 family cysteine peptidase [Bacteriovoracaceae bacterium]